MNSAHTQAGFTLKTMILGCIVIGALAAVGLKLFPVYNTKFKIDQTLSYVAGLPDAGSKSTYELQKSVIANFNISDVLGYNKNNIRQFVKVEKQKGSKDRSLTFKDEIRRPLFGNLDVVMRYEKTVVIPGTGSSL